MLYATAVAPTGTTSPAPPKPANCEATDTDRVAPTPNIPAASAAVSYTRIGVTAVNRPPCGADTAGTK